MNAQVVILHELDDEQYVLLQLRSPVKTIMPWHLSAIGGRHEEGESPRQTALRELEEESGIVPDELREFARGRKCVWFWARLAEQRRASSLIEVADTRFFGVRSARGLPRAPFGHVWMNVGLVEHSRWPVMTGLAERVAAAAAESR